MLDKLQFNNMVISNAKVIQKVRVRIIRKIIARMRKLTTLLEKRPGDSRTIVKQRKCVAIVEQIKKIKRDELMRKILLLEKKPDKIVTNSMSTPEEVSIALFAVNKTIQDVVKGFREQLNYKEEEAKSWKKTLLEIGKQKVKKQRRKKRAEQNEKKTPKKSVKGKSAEESKETTTKCRKESLKPKKIIQSEDDKESSDELEESPDELELEGEETTKVFEENQNKTTMLKDKALKATKKQHENGKRIEKNEKVTKFVTNEETENPEVESQIKYLSGYGKMKSVQYKKADEKPKKVGVVDPFFITSTGDHYIANLEVPDEESDDYDSSVMEKDGFNKRNKKLMQSDRERNHSDRERNDSHRDRNHSDRERNHSDRKRNHSHRDRNHSDRERNQNLKNFKSNRVEEKAKHEDLHPSWLAKKKQSGIADFRGKRINLEEESTQQSTMPIISQKIEKSDLHPSWVAKQKLKPTIAAFQGKKIKFDDSE